MTGYIVRIKRDSGTFANVDVAEMTDAELDRMTEDQRKNPSRDGWNWVKGLAVWIRDNVVIEPARKE